MINSKIGKYLEKIGDYSYSIYLVHFPIIVLFHYQGAFSGTKLRSESLIDDFVIGLLIVSMSIIFYHLIEKPIRQRKCSFYKLFLFIPIIWLIAYLGLLVKNNFTADNLKLIFQSSEDRGVFRCGLINRILDINSPTCNLSKAITNPIHKTILIGDSHADSIKNEFVKAAIKNNTAVYFMTQNDPLKSQRAKQNPDKAIKNLFTHLLNLKINSIVLHYSPKGIALTSIEKLVNLAEKEKIQVVFILPVPIWNKNIPKTLYENIENGMDLPRQNIFDYQKDNKKLIEGLAKIKNQNFKIYSSAEIFCTPDCQMKNDKGEIFYFDSNHLTLTGSNQLKRTFEKIISNLINN